MAHTRQEITLGPIGGLCRIIRLMKRCLGQLDLIQMPPDNTLSDHQTDDKQRPEYNYAGHNKISLDRFDLLIHNGLILVYRDGNPGVRVQEGRYDFDG